MPAVSGPLGAQDAYPLILPFLALPPEAPWSLQPGRFSLSWAATYGNVFHKDSMVVYPDLEVLIDAEVLEMRVEAAYGIARGLEVAASLSLVGEYGGFLDGLIEGFHSLFWLPNGDRDHSPRNQFVFRVVRSGEVLVDLDQPFCALRDLVLSAKWTLLDGQLHSFGAALQGALSLPIGSVERFTSSGLPDASLGLLASWHCSRFALYGGLRYLYLSEPDWGPVLGFRPHNLGFFACLEWAPSASMAWLLQADGMTLPYLLPHPWLSGVSGMISLGSRFRVGRRLLLETHLSEELFSFAALDVALSAEAKVLF